MLRYAGRHMNPQSACRLSALLNRYCIRCVKFTHTQRHKHLIHEFLNCCFLRIFFLCLYICTHPATATHTHTTNRAFNSGQQASGLYIPQLAQLCWKHNEVSSVVQWSYFIWYNNYNNAYSQKCHTYRHKTPINYSHTRKHATPAKSAWPKNELHKLLNLWTTFRVGMIHQEWPQHKVQIKNKYPTSCLSLD